MFIAMGLAVSKSEILLLLLGYEIKKNTMHCTDMTISVCIYHNIDLLALKCSCAVLNHKLKHSSSEQILHLYMKNLQF